MTTQPQPSPPNPEDFQRASPDTHALNPDHHGVNQPARENSQPDDHSQPPSLSPDTELRSQPLLPSPSLNVRILEAGQIPLGAITLVAVIALVVGLIFQTTWIGLLGAVFLLWVSGQMIWPSLKTVIQSWISPQYQQLLLATTLGLVAIAAIAYFIGISQLFDQTSGQINWEAFGALAEAFGAVGQILVAFLALFVAWRQYVISKELTSQQNRITQQQTIDAYFQGISDLVLDEEGLLEDWPSERAIAEGRTAAILTGLNAEGKGKIIRFLSSAKFLAPLKRDRRLGRPIFDGLGGYEEDIEYGVRVIDLGNMLANTDLAGTDLRWTELSEANLAGTDLQDCNLVRANLSRCILRAANLTDAGLAKTRLFYGKADKATPRDRVNPPNYDTGTQTGAVVENADFTNVQGLSEEQRYYCCAWGGAKTRKTIPGGCEGIPDRLGR